MLSGNDTRAAALFCFVLFASASCGASAQSKPASPAHAELCTQLAALAEAASKIHASLPPDGRLTLCHVAADDNDCTKTEILPKALAQKHLAAHATDFSGPCEAGDFVMVAVSGTLEEGFPLRPNLNYVSPTERVDAVFLGRALIRGLRAHLDMKDPDSREYKAAPALNPVNPALVPTGNDQDANVSSIYLVDRRQAGRALLNEPRFLSMTPDLAKVDVQAAETDAAVRALILQAVKETSGLTNTARATFLQVISTWSSCHFLPSPVLYSKPDGTRVTDFPNSLAAFAGTTDAQRTANPSAYNAAVEAAVRAGVEQTKDCIEPAPRPTGPVAVPTRYGVDKLTKRMNDTYRPCAFEEFATRAGLHISLAECPN
ncbi:MAG: hypothetical protein JWN48_4341 [Myxococcaceae bacterium]|nr:hypothetical protein [Myxococcaceae bacterium]